MHPLSDLAKEKYVVLKRTAKDTKEWQNCSELEVIYLLCSRLLEEESVQQIWFPSDAYRKDNGKVEVVFRGPIEPGVTPGNNVRQTKTQVYVFHTYTHSYHLAFNG